MRFLPEAFSGWKLLFVLGFSCQSATFGFTAAALLTVQWSQKRPTVYREAPNCLLQLRYTIRRSSSQASCYATKGHIQPLEDIKCTQL